MAAEPVKSPLHNFPLTFLKWGSKKDQQRFRRTPYDSPPQSDVEPSHSKPVGSRSSRHRRNSNGNHNNNHRTTPATQTQTQAHDDEVDERNCGKKQEVAEQAENEGESEKGWNLRPRRAAAMKGVNNNSNNHGNTVTETANDCLPKSMRLRGFENQGNGGGVAGGGVAEKREKKKFWISLSRDEIEEDIYSMTGSKPSRRPKKRPKNVQKQLDNFFPGLWLVGVSPEAYRGLDVPPKRLPDFVWGQISNHDFHFKPLNQNVGRTFHPHLLQQEESLMRSKVYVILAYFLLFLCLYKRTN